MSLYLSYERSTFMSSCAAARLLHRDLRCSSYNIRLNIRYQANISK